ncbi:MAG TPA: DUF3783 domain-containing protein [Candidatus Thermoplasmatota archaeon]|nr:DUF3783 domain-containing protein [Candidatus Thermoplasmatota archaeon]
MNPGILIYGYDKHDADVIYESITQTLQKPIFVTSAIDNESETINSLIDQQHQNKFEEKDTKIIMFISINNEEIQQILKVFPIKVKRPIFCGLTKHNISWPFVDLKEHLLEERSYWEQQKSTN